MLTKSSAKRTAMHPGTAAELQEGLAAGNLLSGLSATR